MVTKEGVKNQIGPTRLKMSYEEYANWTADTMHTEWVNGEVIVFKPPTSIHQATKGFLHQLLGLFIDLFALGKMLFAPFEMKLQEGSSYREPDILFVANENLERLTEDRLEGPADLVIEIVSDHTVHNDRDDKYKEYQAAGVREYWIIDPRPDKQRADFYHLDETGVYSLFATEDDERVESKVLPGFWLQPAWIWQANSLNPLLAFFEIRGLSAEQVEQIQQMLQTGNRD